MSKDDPTKCPHGNSWISCKDIECFKDLCRAEAEAYCPHGFLAGCPICTKNVIQASPPKDS